MCLGEKKPCLTTSGIRSKSGGEVGSVLLELLALSTQWQFFCPYSVDLPLFTFLGTE